MTPLAPALGRGWPVVRLTFSTPSSRRFEITRSPMAATMRGSAPRARGRHPLQALRLGRNARHFQRSTGCRPGRPPSPTEPRIPLLPTVLISPAVSTRRPRWLAESAAARLNRGCNVAMDRSGNVFVMERDNCRARKIDHSGVIPTVDGTGTCGDAGNGGPVIAVQLDSLCGILAADSLGDVQLPESWSGLVRRIDTAGVITTFAALPTQVERPVVALAADESGRLFLGMEWRVRRIDPNCSCSVIARTGRDGYSRGGGLARSGGLSVSGATVDQFGDVWLADHWGRRIRALRCQ